MPSDQMQTERQEYISFKEYVDIRLAALDKATEVAYQSMQSRLAGMNEFRETLREQASKFVTRTELEIQLDRIESDIRALRESRATLEGKASAQSVYVAYAISLIGIIMGLIGLLNR